MTSKRSRVRRSAVALSAGTLAAAGLIATTAAPATAGQLTETFSTPGTYSWTVPGGVEEVDVIVLGSQGGGYGGRGASVSARLAVAGGQQLTVVVGGRGTRSAGGYGGGGAPGTGNWNGYGGGGASVIRVAGSAAGQPLVVAGGGGGSAGNSTWNVQQHAFYASGGDSGSAGLAGGLDFTGGAGQPGTRWSGGAAGEAGTTTGPSQSGSCSYAGAAGRAGAALQGGAGGSSVNASPGLFAGSGGGGGGGYYGGGGGGASAVCALESNSRPTPAGGGGGGGSSYLDPARIAGSHSDGVRIGDGLVRIMWEDDIVPVAGPTVSPAPNNNDWNNTPVTVTWNWVDPSGNIDPARCPATTTLTRTGITTVASTCADTSGNIGKSSMNLWLRIDMAGPTANPERGADRVFWHWSDALSGIDGGRCPDTTAYDVQATCFDLAGNATTLTVPHP
jgi:hypothetical protein